jgi:DNA replication protein DnaC
MPRPTPSTPDAPVNTGTWAKWFEFETLDEPQLERMVRAAAQFVLDVRANKPCPWLVLVGTSGAGKTHLARRIWRWWTAIGKFNVQQTPKRVDTSGQFCSFPKFIKECKGGDFGRTDDLANDRLVVLDDIGAGTDPKPWIASTLLTIIEGRMDDRKATVITANLSVEEVASMYDPRIASRLVRRGQDKVIQVELPDYKLRTT